MHAPLDRPGRNKINRGNAAKSLSGFVILPVVIAVVVLALILKHPKSSIWISEAVQAEFGGFVQQPTQLAEPTPHPTPVNGTIGSTQATYRDQR